MMLESVSSRVARDTLGKLTSFDERLRELWVRSKTPCFLCDSVRNRHGVIVDFNIRHHNEAAGRFAWEYFRRRRVDGHTLTTCCPKFWSAPGAMDWLTAVVETGETQFRPPMAFSPRDSERSFVMTAIKSGAGIALLFRDATLEVNSRKALLERQAELHEAQRLGSIGSWQMSLKTGDVSWSPECHRLVGSDPSQPPPKFDQQDRFVTRESWILLNKAVRASVRTGKPYDIEVEIVRNDGVHCWLRTRGEVCRNSAGKVVGMRGTVQDIRDRKILERELRALPQKILLAQEAERRRVAAELHDSVTQNLVACLHRLHAAGKADNPRRNVALKAACRSVTEVVQEVRRISCALRPAILDDLGLVVALRELTREFRQRTKISVGLVLPRWKRRLREDLELVVYRVTQEALTNIERHSQAKRVDLVLMRRGADLFCHIRDNGRGFDPAAAARRLSFGLGLHSMRERVELVGGYFDLETAASKGTKIMVQLPFSFRP